MSQLRITIALGITIPKYIYVNTFDEAVVAIKAVNETIRLTSQKSVIVNLEQFDSSIHDWVFWIDELGRDIHEYIRSLDCPNPPLQ